MHIDDLQKIQTSLNAEVVDQLNDLSEGSDNAAYKEEVFTRVMLDYLLDFGAIEGGEAVYFERKTGYGTAKANGYYFDEDEGHLDIFVSLMNYMDEVRSMPKGEVKKILERAARVYLLAQKSYHDEMERAHDDYSMLESMNMNQSVILTKRIVLLSNYTFDFDPADLTVGDFTVDLWDLKRLFKNVTSVKGHETIEIDFSSFDSSIKCLPIDHFNETYETFLAVIPGQILADLYERYSSRLLELNVRSFLQAKGKINQKIRDTIKNNPEMFLAYNNGITVVSDNVEMVKDEAGVPILKTISGFQIVNGGQTTASLHRAFKEKADLSRIAVQAKITIVDENSLEEVVPLISKYSNSQNKVSEADFSSNSPYHVEIQQLSEQIWLPGDKSRWFYERTRGQYQVQKSRYSGRALRDFTSATPTSQKFTKTDLAKYVNSWDQFPHIVSLGAQKNFVKLMEKIKNDHPKDWKPDKKYYKDLIAKARLFKEVDKIARSVGISSYKANVVSYTVAYLSYRTAKNLDLDRIWTTQQLDSSLIEMLEYWIPQISNQIVNSADGRNVTEWCKKKECWEGVKELNLALSPDWSNLLSGDNQEALVEIRNGQAEIVNDQDEINNARARVMQITSEIWHRIEQWGFRTQELKEYQCGIASSMAGMAMRHWKKRPSAKQALAAAKILDIALNEVIAEMNEEKEFSGGEQPIDVSQEIRKWMDLKAWLKQNDYLDEYNDNLIMEIEFELRQKGVIADDLKRKGEQLMEDAFLEGWEMHS